MLKLINQDRFRFTEKGHKHEILIDGVWQEKVGCSSVAGMFDDKGWFGYWAAGLALKPLGWVKLEKDKSNIEEVERAASEGLAMLDNHNFDTYLKLLDTCYRAHAKETKDTADIGKQAHLWISNYILNKIKDN